MVDRTGTGHKMPEGDEGVGKEAGEIEQLLQVTHAIPILGCIFSLSLIVIIVMLCAKCKEKKQ